MEKYTREWFVEQGRSGGTKTKELYGVKHFKKLNQLKKNKKKVDNSKKASKSPIK